MYLEIETVKIGDAVFHALKKMKKAWKNCGESSWFPTMRHRVNPVYKTTGELKYICIPVSNRHEMVTVRLLIL